MLPLDHDLRPFLATAPLIALIVFSTSNFLLPSLVILGVSYFLGTNHWVCDKLGQKLDPCGGPMWKNAFAFLLAKIGELKQKHLPHDEAERFPHEFAEVHRM